MQSCVICDAKAILEQLASLLMSLSFHVKLKHTEFTRATVMNENICTLYGKALF